MGVDATRLKLLQVEEILDNAHKTLRAVTRPRTEALWLLLARADLRVLLNSKGLPAPQFGAIVDNLINDLQHAIAWIVESSPPGGNEPTHPVDFSDTDDLLNSAQAYSKMSTVFPLWHR